MEQNTTVMLKGLKALKQIEIFESLDQAANLEQAQRHGKAFMVYTSEKIEVEDIRKKHPHLSEQQHFDKQDSEHNKLTSPMNNASSHRQLSPPMHENPTLERAQSQEDRCICCDHMVNGKPIPLRSKMDEIYHIGSGYALFFRFIEYLMYLLLIIFFVSGLFNIITNVQGSDCATTQEAALHGGSVYCTQGYILTYSIANKRNNSYMLTVNMVLNLVSMAIIIVFFHLIRYRFRQTQIDVDDKTVTPSDYTCVVTNFDAEATEDDIRKWIQGLITIDNDDIIRIVRSGVDQKRLRAMAKKNQVQQLNSNLAVNCKVFYVTFRQPQQAADLEDRFKKTLRDSFKDFFHRKLDSHFYYKGQEVTVEGAPEPTDIEWENLQYTMKEKQCWSYVTNISAVIAVGCTFGIILLVKWGQFAAAKAYGSQSIVIQIISAFISVIINITNFLLEMLINYLTKFERHNTTTNYLKGVAQKLAFAQFFNTAITPLCVELILVEDTASGVLDVRNKLQYINIYGSGGLLEGIFWIFVTGAFIPPALSFFDPSYIIKVLKRKWVIKHNTLGKMSQRDANRLFSGSETNMPPKFAQMIKLLLFTSFYAPALPISLIFAIAGLFLLYWVEKYILIRRAAYPNSLGHQLATEMVEYAEWATGAYSVGNLICIYSLKSSADDYAYSDAAFAVAWVMFGVSLLHIFFPMGPLNEFLFKLEDEVTEPYTYEQARDKFVDIFSMDYHIELELKKYKDLKKEHQKNAKAVSALSPVTPKTAEADMVAEDVKLIDHNSRKNADKSNHTKTISRLRGETRLSIDNSPGTRSELAQDATKQGHFTTNADLKLELNALKSDDLE